MQYSGYAKVGIETINIKMSPIRKPDAVARFVQYIHVNRIPTNENAAYIKCFMARSFASREICGKNRNHIAIRNSPMYCLLSFDLEFKIVGYTPITANKIPLSKKEKSIHM